MKKIDSSRIEDLGKRYALMTNRTEDIGIDQVKAVIEKTLYDIITLPEYIECKKLNDQYEQAINELHDARDRATRSLNKKIQELESQVVGLKQQRNIITRKISENLMEFGEDANNSSLYLQLDKVEQEVRQKDTILQGLKMDKKYPGTQETIKKGRAAFEIGLAATKASVNLRNKTMKEFNDTARTIEALLRAAGGELGREVSREQLRMRTLAESYCHFNLQYTNEKWSTLEQAVAAEIDKKLSERGA